MFHGDAKCSTERVKSSQMIDGGAKYSTERVKYSTEVLDIPMTM